MQQTILAWHHPAQIIAHLFYFVKRRAYLG